MVKYTYDAWGKVLSATGSLASTLGTVQPFRYRGYVYDVETGFYYLISRYYFPIWQRFVNADNLIQGNMFAYCYSNPVKLSDKTGNSSDWDDKDISLIDLNIKIDVPKSTIPYSSLLEGNYYIITPLCGSAAVHELNDRSSTTVATAYRDNKKEPKIMHLVCHIPIRIICWFIQAIRKQRP